MRHRDAHKYPPYHRMARIVLRSREEQAGAAFADAMAASFTSALQAMQSAGPAEVRLLGPAEAPVFRLKGYHRFHYQLQSPSPATLHKLLRAVMPTLHPPAGIELALDIDPFSML
jgi:primosomal protein N' (replication factor Y)